HTRCHSEHSTHLLAMSAHPPPALPSPFTHPPTTEIYPLSLHDALPICPATRGPRGPRGAALHTPRDWSSRCPRPPRSPPGCAGRSEEHTSELQSRVDLVCRLLLEKKKESFFDNLLWPVRCTKIYTSSHK